MSFRMSLFGRRRLISRTHRSTRSGPQQRSRSSGATHRPLQIECLESRQLLAADFLGAFVPSQSGGLDFPGGLVFGPNGDLFVGSREGSDSILRYDATTGAPLGAFVPSGSGGLDGPFDLAFGPDGSLYVSSWEGTHTIIRYDGTTGAHLDTFVAAGYGGLTAPTGLVFDRDGNLLVSSYDSGQILKYLGPNNASEGHPAGEFLGEFAFTGVGSSPDYLTFGPDGNLYVGLPNHLTPTPYDGIINRYDGTSGAFIDTFVPTGEGGLTDMRGIAFDREGNLIVAEPVLNSVLRYQGPNGQSPGAYVDALVPSGLGGLQFPTGIALDASGNLYVGSRDTDAVLRYGAIKFYVVDDASSNLTYEYTNGGISGESYSLNISNSAPRGAASNVAGTKVWVVDANKKAYVYDTSGGLLGSWTPKSLTQPEGIATNGTDVWIVDAAVDTVFRYTGAAARTSGNQKAASSFSLHSDNRNPKDIVTDGTYLWVINDSTTDSVFKYTLAGTLVGRWTIVESGNANPTGITVDPSNPSHLWIVDNGTDRVYQYDGAVSRTSGSQAASASFPLAAGNTNPQGIADPPPASVRLAEERAVAELPVMGGPSLPLDGIARAHHTSNDQESSLNRPGKLKSTARSAHTSIVERAVQGLFQRQNVELDRSEPERRENAARDDDMVRYQLDVDALMSESNILNEVLSL